MCKGMQTTALTTAYDKANERRIEVEKQLSEAMDLIRSQEAEIELMKAALIALKNGWNMEDRFNTGTHTIIPPFFDHRKMWAEEWVTIADGVCVPNWITRECHYGYMSEEDVLKRGDE